MEHNLKKVRNKLSLTHKEMADKLKISKSLYEKIENGKRNFDLDFIVNFSRLTKTKIYDLIDINTFIKNIHFNFKK